MRLSIRRQTNGSMELKRNVVSFLFTNKLEVVGLCFLMLFCFPPCCNAQNEKVNVSEVQKWLQENEKDDVTYNQIKKWFEHLQGNNTFFDAYPRLFSFCTTSEHVTERVPPGTTLHAFKDILKEIETEERLFYDFDLKEDLGTEVNDSWKLDVHLSRINTPESDMVNLRQWMHIRVTSKSGLKGLLMQSIVGPLGLPFGEFSVEFPCQDFQISKTQHANKIATVAYCAYRAKAAITHPMVYVAKTDTPQTEFHVNFRWSDITCMETPYLQLVMIAVKDFKPSPKKDVDFKPLLSPVFLNTAFDSFDGAPYPYYPDWEDKMWCDLKDDSDFRAKAKVARSSKTGADADFAQINWQRSDSVFRIQSNEHYDACILKLTNDPAKMPDDRLQCPPGPFQCDESYAEKVKGDVTKDREELVASENKTSKCYPCAAPPCVKIYSEESKCRDVIDVSGANQIGIIEVEKLETNANEKSHGIWSMLSFLILIPIANFMARFYKEVCSDFLCGNGPWLLVHIAAHIGSVVIMWTSIGPVLPALGDYAAVLKQCEVIHGLETQDAFNCAKEKSFENPHVVIGILAFVLQHFVLLFGFSRLSNNFIRMIQVALHSHFGYLTFFLGGASALSATFNSKCLDVKLFSVFLFILPILFSGVGVVLDCMTDRRLGIRPLRKQWPVLEPVKIEGKGPFTLVKWVVLGSMSLLLGLLWVLILSSYSRSSEVPTFLKTPGVDPNLVNEKLKSYSPKGLFGECT